MRKRTAVMTTRAVSSKRCSGIWEWRVARRFFRWPATSEPKSLQLTRTVLDELERLEAAVEGLGPQVQVFLAKVDELKVEARLCDDMLGLKTLPR